ncbi:hypothetical protein Bca52824_003728 [Brassica carinata]|uniref:Uncharacterized protein n=1 Tax=Brassica carinata TaxID=52824 RepID=A0A8X7WQR8_BRACI|nr:hypothetical protein Bca52824_003728 [Brassica carinata]
MKTEEQGHMFSEVTIEGVQRYLKVCRRWMIGSVEDASLERQNGGELPRRASSSEDCGRRRPVSISGYVV